MNDREPQRFVQEVAGAALGRKRAWGCCEGGSAKGRLQVETRQEARARGRGLTEQRAAEVGRRGRSEKPKRLKALVLEGQEGVTCCLVSLAWVTGGHGTISRWDGEGAGLSLVLSAVWHKEGLEAGMEEEGRSLAGCD